jgi:hypothetical protein
MKANINLKQFAALPPDVRNAFGFPRIGFLLIRGSASVSARRSLAELREEYRLDWKGIAFPHIGRQSRKKDQSLVWQ